MTRKVRAYMWVFMFDFVLFNSLAVQSCIENRKCNPLVIVTCEP